MPQKSEQPLPAALLARISADADRLATEMGQKSPIWREIDEFIPEAREQVHIDWPESVFMPFGLWPSFMERYFRLPERSFDLDHPLSRGMAQILACLAPWRATQDIVRFDPDIQAELLDMEPAGKLPSGILLRLPAWCVYIDAALRVDGDDYDGFFVQLDANRDGLYMALTFQGSDQRQQRIPLMLGDLALDESVAAINRIAKSAGEGIVDAADPGLAQALNLVTYLCSYGLADRQDYTGTDISWPTRRKTKRGWRIFPPDRPRTHLLGAGYGEIIRKGRLGTASGGHAVRPHVRRPHWHHFWAGSRDARSLVVHWLPPIFVGNAEKEEDGDNA